MTDIETIKELINSNNVDDVIIGAKVLLENYSNDFIFNELSKPHTRPTIIEGFRCIRLAPKSDLGSIYNLLYRSDRSFAIVIYEDDFETSCTKTRSDIDRLIDIEEYNHVKVIEVE